MSDEGAEEGEEGSGREREVGMHEREPWVSEGGTRRELGSRGVCAN